MLRRAVSMVSSSCVRSLSSAVPVAESSIFAPTEEHELLRQTVRRVGLRGKEEGYVCRVGGWECIRSWLDFFIISQKAM